MFVCLWRTCNGSTVVVPSILSPKPILAPTSIICLHTVASCSYPFQVAAGLECGVGVDDYDEWQEGDVIEAFELVKKARSLEDASKNASKMIADRSTALGLDVAA